MKKPFKKFVFVLMPFEKSFDDLYNFGIKQTCAELGTYCERVDEQIFSERILDRVYNQISKADILVADMSDRNPNVFYEVGYAHGIGKNVILLTKKADDIPFDLKHFPHIVYDGEITKLSEKLRKKVEWFLNDENAEIIEDVNFNLNFLIDGQSIKEGETIDLSGQNDSFTNVFSSKIDIHNLSESIYSTKFKVGLEFSEEFISLIGKLETIKPSKKKVLFVSKEQYNIYPQAFKSFDFDIHRPIVDNDNVVKDLTIDCKLKVFTIFELKEINFKFKISTCKNYDFL